MGYNSSGREVGVGVVVVGVGDFGIRAMCVKEGGIDMM